MRVDLRRGPERLVLAMGAILVALARARPRLILIDDLQWADELSIGWLGYVLRGDELVRSDFSIVGAYRSEEPGEALAELLSASELVPRRLGRLDSGEFGARGARARSGAPRSD